VELLSAVLGIVIIDLVLSGDNAVVIGMAAHRLPPRQRRFAILIGGGAAIALRISLTATATLLLTLPLLRAIGGVLLLWIAWKLLKDEEESAEGVRVAGSMREAITTILLADFIMSLDNVLGVAAAARGDIGLLMFGLVFSMAILMIGGGITASLLNRFWWLVYIGAGVIAWVGAKMLLEDPYVEQVLHLPTAVHLPVLAVATAATLALAHTFHRHLPRRRRAAEDMLRATGTQPERIHEQERPSG
jgi:YjbE family integral membrane protein